MFTFKVTYKDTIYSFPKDTTLLDIAKQFKDKYQFDILVATLDNKIVELSRKLEKDCTVDFYDMSSVIGNKVYERALLFIYFKAVREILACDVEVKHSLDKGVYTEVLTAKELTQDNIDLLSGRMHEIAKEALPFEKISVSRLEAIEFFKSNGQSDKAESLKYITNSYVNLYKLDKTYDYLYGEMPLNTASITNFVLSKVEDKGIVISYPNIYNDCATVPYQHHDKLFKQFRDNHEWCDKVSLQNIADLNHVIANGDSSKLIYMSEIEQNGRLLHTARLITNNKNIKMVLLAGPSSSGKTTTSKKLSLFLQSMGYNPHSISIDDYFLDREKTPLKDNGEHDFESLGALNVDLFNVQLLQLLNHEEVLLPEYNFITGTSEFKKKYLKLEEKDILIIEGLHALNEDLTKSVATKNKYKIYISPLTSINLDNHNRLSTSDNRLLRRMVRDNKYRGYKANYTLAKWQDVRQGEEKYVFPYQDAADEIFNTSLVYELGVLRLYAEPLLFSIAENDPYYNEAIRLLNVLRNILPITSDSIPLDSIIREFIGDSYFKD